MPVFLGAAADDSLQGTSDDDTLNGGVDQNGGDAAPNQLWSGAGSDLLCGAEGAGVFGGGFTTGEDTLDLTATTTDFTDLASVQAAATETADGVLIDLGGGDSVLLSGLALSDLGAVDFVF